MQGEDERHSFFGHFATAVAPINPVRQVHSLEAHLTGLEVISSFISCDFWAHTRDVVVQSSNATVVHSGYGSNGSEMSGTGPTRLSASRQASANTSSNKFTHLGMAICGLLLAFWLSFSHSVRTAKTWIDIALMRAIEQFLNKDSQAECVTFEKKEVSCAQSQRIRCPLERWSIDKLQTTVAAAEM